MSMAMSELERALKALRLSGMIATLRLSVLLTTSSAIVAVNSRRGNSRSTWSGDLLSVGWSFIRRRHRLCTVRMGIDGKSTRTRPLTFWVTPFVPDGRRIGGENSSSTSVPVSAMLQPRRSGMRSATGSLVVGWTGGSTIWRGCSIPSSGVG